jgi:hypothetical protein
MAEAFDLGAAKNELRELRRRGRELETRITEELRRQLRAMQTACYSASDVNTLLTDVRQFVDESRDR